MKKKFFAFMLAFAILLTSLVGVNNVSFAEDVAFKIYEDGVLKRSSSDVDDISAYLDENKAYTIKLLKDLVVPADGGHLKTITLKGNVTVEGYGKKISGASNGTAGDRLIKIEAGSKVTIDGLILDGEDKYAGVEAKAYDTAIDLVLQNSTIEACTAISNRNEGSGGALDLLNAKFTIDGTTIKNCKAKTGGAINIGGDDPDLQGIINNSTLDGNSSEQGGAIFNDSVNLDISNSKIINNAASAGAGILHEQANLTLKNTIVNYNKALPDPLSQKLYENYCDGGGIYIGILGDYNVSIDGGEISYNYSDNHGGGILISEYDFVEYEPIENISINSNVIFKGNKAGDGYLNPPDFYKQYNDFARSKHSKTGRLINESNNNEWVHVESLLNNYDIEYVNPITTITYDPNGASGDLFVEAFKTEYLPRSSYIKSYTVIVKSLAETKISNSRRFLGWNTEPDGSGTNYAPGQNFEHKGNLYLFAQWEKPSITLTLDENYRGGKVTEKELLVGDLIEPHLYKPKRRGHTFKGWSYNKKHLDKVHYDDRIYEDTTVYAIWDEVEEEPEEIKGEEHKAYIFGYPDGTVRPNGEITRAEAAAMLARLLEIESIGSAEAPSFPDTPSAWYNKAINAVVQRGIMKGYPDGTFKPNDAITRAEFTQMIWAIDNKPYGTAPFADVVGHWAERPIGSEYQAGRILGYPDGTFRPDAHITRCEAAVILNKIFERNFDNMSLIKCKNPQMIKYFIDLDASFWGYNELVEATNTHEYIRRTKGRVEENWLLIK